MRTRAYRVRQGTLRALLARRKRTVGGGQRTRTVGWAWESRHGRCVRAPSALGPARCVDRASALGPPSLDSSVVDGSALFDAADAHHFDAKGHDPPDASLDAADGSTQKPEDYRYTDRTGTITINVRTCAPVVLTYDGVCDARQFALVGEEPRSWTIPRIRLRPCWREAPQPEVGLLGAVWIDRDLNIRRRSGPIPSASARVAAARTRISQPIRSLRFGCAPRTRILRTGTRIPLPRTVITSSSEAA
jgi:hypothetical protein